MMDRVSFRDVIAPAGHPRAMLGIDRAFKRLLSVRVGVIANTPAESVFRCLADIPGHEEWLLLGAIHKTSEEPVGMGSTFTFSRFMFLPRFFSNRLEVTDFVPNQHLAYKLESHNYGYRQLYSFDVQAASRGSRITCRVEWLHFGLYLTLATLLALPVTLVALPLLRVQSRATVRRGLERIESRVAKHQRKLVV